METLLEKPRTYYSYEEFVKLTEDLLAENKTTGTNHSEAYLDYTRLNLQRMNRVYKTTKINEDLKEKMTSIQGRYQFLVLVEAWCGDVPQNFPVLAKIAELSDNIELRGILRDENLDIMDSYLAYGGRGIPKLIIFEQDSKTVVGEWGPRPFPAQKMVLDYKAIEGDKPAYSEFVKTVQMWYAKDRTQTLQREILELLKALA